MWWVSDALGMLLITPFVVAWSDFQLRGAAPPRPARVWPRASCAAPAWCSSATGRSACHRSPTAPVPPLTHFLIPFLVWAALRFGVRGQSTAVMIVCVISVWDTMRGLGPFSAAFVQPDRSVLYLQIFLIVAAADDAGRRGGDEGAALRAARRRGMAPALRDGGGVERQSGLRRQSRAPAGGVGRRHAEILGCAPERDRATPRPGWRACIRMTARRSCSRCAACGPGEERAYSLEYRVQGRDGAYIEVEDTGRVIGCARPARSASSAC